MNAELKSFLYAKMYRHPRVLRMHNKAGRVLRDLFGAFMDEPAMLPASAQEQYAALPKARGVCFYIAGMTDRFALDEHARLFDPRERV
jgi:dGTPase